VNTTSFRQSTNRALQHKLTIQRTPGPARLGVPENPPITCNRIGAYDVKTTNQLQPVAVDHDGAEGKGTARKKRCTAKIRQLLGDANYTYES
jgi:hypothetical protein